MSLVDGLTALATRIANEFKTVRTEYLPKSILTADGNIVTRAAGVPAEVTRAALAGDTAFTSRYPPGREKVNNLSVGSYAGGPLATGLDNVAVGQSAQNSLSTGSQNTAVGEEAQASMIGDGMNSAVGYFAQRFLVGGSANTAVGALAQQHLTTGRSNTAVGFDAGEQAPGQSTGVTTIGASATGTAFGTSLGYSANAAFVRSVAVGAFTVSTLVDQVAFGPRHLELGAVSAPGAPAAGTARLYTDGVGTLSVQYPTGPPVILGGVQSIDGGDPVSTGTGMIDGGVP